MLKHLKNIQVMKSQYILIASCALVCGLSACDGKLDVDNPNQQTIADFGKMAAELNEAVIAAYNHTRIEGTYARVGYTIDLCRGDEVWNASQVWYLPFDNLNVGASDGITEWPWRDWYYTINVTNYILSKVESAGLTDELYKQIKGQALFLRGLGYYNLTAYYQDVPLITDYADYSTIEGLYKTNNTQDEVLDQVEQDFKEAMQILPSRDIGGQWAKGRATCGSAAGYYARTLMFRHKFSEANTVLKDIISGKYGAYDLVKDYGDNFREGTAYENNVESLYEVQYLDYGQQGTDDEWTADNTSSNATQGHAVESNFGPADFGGWADLSASPWLYNLFKAEKTTSGQLDPRLYWTIGTYEAEYDSYTDGRSNMMYQKELTANDSIVTNTNNGGIPIVKHTAARENLYNAVVTGLHCGVNIRLLRFADILLLAAECENEVNGPNQTAIDYINRVRNRVGLAELSLSDFSTKDKLFEQIANVERPKELGCEFGRGIDLIRWGFYYSTDRKNQLKAHGSYTKSTTLVTESPDFATATASTVESRGNTDSSYNYYENGHEYLPVPLAQLNANPNLRGNSANETVSNAGVYSAHSYTIHPVVNLSE